ncbi:MAG TPA: TRAP transporter substrate-binding protein [Spirochaetia bacterium]|nr:TRAP transporter substrate-binding protein [Spirochaetia bacterium]
MRKHSKMIVIAMAMIVLAAVVWASGSKEQGAAAGSSSGAAAAKTYSWSLASVLPASHPVNKSLEYFAQLVSDTTGGHVKIKVYPGGQLGDESAYIEGIKLGTIDMAKVSSAPLGQYDPKLQVLSLPYIFSSEKQQQDVLDGPIGQQLMAGLSAKGYKGLTFLDAGFRSFTVKAHPINTPADLKGLKIRVMQSQPLIDVVNALGAVAVPMGQSEVYTALQQGVIDGWENNLPTVLAFNMQEVCKYFSYDRHASIPDILIMNPKKFDELPAEYQKAVMDAAAKTSVFQVKIWNDYVGTAKAELEKKGLIINEISDLKAFQKYAQPIYDKFAPTVGKDLIEKIINTP